MSEENKEITQVTVTALESIERASIDMQISTAKRYPMHSPQMLSKVKENMLTLATLDEETAAACFYTLPRGGKAIQGPSVRTAEIALNCYGNIRIGTRIVEVISYGGEPHVVVQAVCHDLENNALITIEKRRRITKKKFSDKIDEDDIQLAVNSCTSIAYRDAAFKLIPMAIIKPVWQAAKAVATGDVRSLVAKRTEVIEKLKKMGAVEANILAVVGCRKVEDIGMDELGQLIGLGTALKDGETTLEDAFPAPVKDEPPVSTTDRIKNKLKDKETPVTPPAEEPKAETPKSKKAKDKPKEEPKPEPENVPDPEITEPEPGEPKEKDTHKCTRCDRTQPASTLKNDKCGYCLGLVTVLA
jgi:hypothetical protein